MLTRSSKVAYPASVALRRANASAAWVEAGSLAWCRAITSSVGLKRLALRRDQTAPPPGFTSSIASIARPS